MYLILNFDDFFSSENKHYSFQKKLKFIFSFPSFLIYEIRNVHTFNLQITLKIYYDFPKEIQEKITYSHESVFKRKYSTLPSLLKAEIFSRLNKNCFNFQQQKVETTMRIQINGLFYLLNISFPNNQTNIVASVSYYLIHLH